MLSLTGFTIVDIEDRISKSDYIRVRFLEGVTAYFKPHRGYTDYHFHKSYPGESPLRRASAFLHSRHGEILDRPEEVVVRVRHPETKDRKTRARARLTP